MFSEIRKTVFEIFLGKNTAECLEPLLREKPDPKRFGKDAPNPEPWRVISHGDCWSNNMLYRYDPETEKPAEIVLVDLQMAQESCVINDLQYVTYACTDGELRKNHLNELLELYHDKFNLVCETMKCPTLPGFNLDSLKYRFHRSKLLGYFMASGGLPIMLKEEDKVVNMEELCEDKDVMEAFRDICGGSSGNDVFRKRLIDVTTDMVNDGVL